VLEILGVAFKKPPSNDIPNSEHDADYGPKPHPT
jgi:hypothetical protein